jgi:nitrite reductase/ring-hydroxylating ferredoxin subunit
MWREAARLDDVFPGGMKTVRLEGEEITLCHVDGTVYAIGRRCGHMNAPMEQGTLAGWVVTCPYHCARFDVRSGHALSYPVGRDPGPDPKSPTSARYSALHKRLKRRIRMDDLPTWPARVVDGAIEVDI